MLCPLSFKGETMSNEHIGKILKQQRIMSGLTVHQLGDKSGVSPSHLGRIERGERFPSARILKKIAQPLCFQEETLLVYCPALVLPGRDAACLCRLFVLSICRRGKQPTTGYLGGCGPLRGGGAITRAGRVATYGSRNSHYLQEHRPKMRLCN